MGNVIARFRSNQKRVRFQYLGWMATPFLGFIYGVSEGFMVLILLSPVWAIVYIVLVPRLKNALDFEIVLNTLSIRVNSVSQEEIPLFDIRFFRIEHIYLPKYGHVPILVADFYDESKFKNKRVSLDANLSSYLYKGGVALQNLYYFKEDPEEIVSVLNKQLNISKKYKGLLKEAN